MSARPQRRYSFIFVVDGPQLEAMSLLLAATLRRQHPWREVEIVAYVSARTLPNLSRTTRRVYERCKVRIEPLIAPEDSWNRPYPHGNKLFACAARRDTDAAVFFDTDMVCLAPMPLDDLPLETAVAAVPEGKPTWGYDSDRWERAYAHLGLEVPEERVRLNRGRQLEFYPYFNAGLVAFSDREVQSGRSFGEVWLETAKDFDWNCPVGGKRPWLDQITLPLTIRSLGLDTHVLEESWNFSLSNRRRLGNTRTSLVLHYHKRRFLERVPQFARLMLELAVTMDDPMRELLAFAEALGEPPESGPRIRRAANPAPPAVAARAPVQLPTMPTMS